MSLLREELSIKQIAACFEVSNEFLARFLEIVNAEALFTTLHENGFIAFPNAVIDVQFRNHSLGQCYADIFVEGKVIVEIDVVPNIFDEPKAQVIY